VSAQEREALARELSKSRAPDWWDGMRAATFEDLDGVDRPYSVPDDEDYATADALLAAGWTRPGPDGDAIEQARNVVMSAIRCYMPFGWEEGEPDGFAASIVRDLEASGLLASPVREPGRSEAEIKAEALREGDVADVTLTLEVGDEEEDW